MAFDIELHIAAGLGALLLGLGALFRSPGRPRNRLFVLLCVSLAIWMLGVAFSSLGGGSPGRSEFPWHVVTLFGSCSAVPLGLHFLFRMVRVAGGRFRILLPVAYSLSAALWITSWTPLHDRQPAWNLAAMAILGAILLAGIVPIWLQVASLGPGLERRVYRLFLRGAAVAVVGGLSDLVPRGTVPVPKIGPAAVLVFLLIVSAIVIRHRFLDVAGALARAVALVIGAFGASLFLYWVAGLSGGRLFPIFLATLLVLATVRPAWRFLIAGTHSLFYSGNPLTTALQTLSQELPHARDRQALLEAIERGLNLVPGEMQIGIYVRRRDRRSYRLAYRRAMDGLPLSVPERGTLPVFLEGERALITLHAVEDEHREARGRRRQIVREVLDEFRRLGIRALVPVFYGDQLGAWGVLGSDIPEDLLTVNAISTFRVVASQAMESLHRIEAIEDARQREALVAVGEMAGGLAHEVRNPVGAIRGAAQVLMDEKDPGRAREMLQVIQEETDRLGRVVGEFLGYARPVNPQMRAVDLGTIAREAIKAAEMAGKGLRAEVKVAPETPTALGDPDQLQRVFLNLVCNARESAGPEGHLWVRVAPDDHGRVSIRFEDDGPGIAPEMQGRLFQPFQSTKERGTGLGLALVQRVVDAHGGRISVEDRADGGATFMIVLPASEEACQETSRTS